ncbi:MAG: CvpA family protein [Oscillospiraceae bacterium]
MNYIYDAVIIVVLLVGIWSGYRRGLLSSLISLGGFIISILGAMWLSNRFAASVYEKYVAPKISTGLLEKFASSEAAKPFVSQGAQAVSDALDAMLTKLVEALIFIVAVVVLFLLISLIANALKLFNKIPILGAANKILGAVIGVAQGLIVCYLLVTVVALMIKTGSGTGIFSESIVAKTFLFSFIYRYNPLRLGI